MSATLAPRQLARAKEAEAFDYYPRLRRVRQHVIENLADSISLAEAASVAGLEARYFSKVFHRRVGLRFRDWLALLRVARAIELLEHRNYQIAHVGDLAGFRDRRTFQRTFKRWLGMTPSEYRDAVRSRKGVPELSRVGHRSPPTPRL